MNTFEKVTILVVCFGGITLVLRRPVGVGVRQGLTGWRTQPSRMVGNLVTGFVFGQGIFWLIGYDQLGFFMSPFKEFGLGRIFAELVAAYLPQTFAVGATVKTLEIVTDALRMWTEGAVYRRHGFVPDVVATLFSQPLWTDFEVAEKITGWIVRSSFIGTPQQIVLSLAAIYGNLFRYALDLGFWLWGDKLYWLTGRPVERGMQAIARAFGRR